MCDSYYGGCMLSLSLLIFYNLQVGAQKVTGEKKTKLLKILLTNWILIQP